jgi:hypothetical protein
MVEPVEDVLLPVDAMTWPGGDGARGTLATAITLGAPDDCTAYDLGAASA